MADLIGQSLGRYHILKSLGEGGMAMVYKAYDTRLERDLAIKVIRVEKFRTATLRRVLQRFEREAKSLAKLSHPNIVGIIDYGKHKGMPYLVMEYLPGGTLKHRLGKPIPYQKAAKMLVPVARALAYAHEQKIIHRDVKPSNILITQSGEPMLSDFGIAKILETEDTVDLTGTGIGVGTPEYMPPEQAQGKLVDARSDIYSLGVVFYEMLTGRRPYEADTPLAVLVKQASEPLPPPRQFVPDLPGRVEQVLLKAMAKQPEDRYQSMGEFAAALEGLGTISSTAGITDGASKHARPVGPEATALAGSHANWKHWLPVAGLGGLAVLACLVVAIILIVNIPLFRHAPTPSITPTHAITPAFTPSYTFAPTQTPAPAFTSTFTVLAATPTPMGFYYPLPNCAGSRIHLGDFVKLETNVDSVTIRSDPDTHPSDNKIGSIVGNDRAEIIDGPVCNWKWILWKINRVSDGLIGWVPESNGTEFWLVPVK